IVFMLLGASVLLIGAAYGYVYFKTKDFPQPSEPVNMPNPIVVCNSEADFAQYGLKLKTPEEADEVRYSVIGGKIAEINCQINGEEYCFRCGKSEDVQSLSGIYGQWVKLESDGKADYYQVKGDPKYFVAGWTADGLVYAVSTKDSSENLSAVIGDYLK
ncbi:MAG: hypothetical protein II126_01665, partial [Erysipelotrichaceae bacterium]|nr:hypothetical protein [Erysipelotrichaceae bacterium]